MDPRKSPVKGTLARSSRSPTKSYNLSTKSPVKSFPSPTKSPAKSGPRPFSAIPGLAPMSNNESNPIYANPDEISLSSSEDTEQAGPISDPQQLIEEIHHHNGPALLPDATSPSDTSPARRDPAPAQAGANTTKKSETTNITSFSKRDPTPAQAGANTAKRSESTKTTSSASGVKKSAGGSGGAKKVVKTKTKTKTKTVTLEMVTLETVRNTRSKRKEIEFKFGALDALLVRQRQEKKQRG